MSVSQILRTGAGVLIGYKSELSQWKYGTSTRESIAPITCLKMLKKNPTITIRKDTFCFDGEQTKGLLRTDCSKARETKLEEKT